MLQHNNFEVLGSVSETDNQCNIPESSIKRRIWKKLYVIKSQTQIKEPQPTRLAVEIDSYNLEITIVAENFDDCDDLDDEIDAINDMPLSDNDILNAAHGTKYFKTTLSEGDTPSGSNTNLHTVNFTISKIPYFLTPRL